MPEQRFSLNVTSPTPTGTVTFLFTDIEGSTARWEAYRTEMGAAVRLHDELVHKAIEQRGGYVFKRLGDAFCASFARVSDAMNAALAIQRVLATAEFGNVDGVRVRIALHTGEAEERDGDYFGPAVNRVARILSSAHGEQIVLSGSTARLAERANSGECEIRHLGSFTLKDLADPEEIYQLLADDLRRDFPPLRTADAQLHNLPRQLTSFVGRSDVVSEIQTLVVEHPLVTLMGAGGVGKTRTALQASQAVLDSYDDGVWFVDLAPLTDPLLVPSALASVFGVQDTGRRPLMESLVLAIKAKNALIILDNCEHVVAAAADAISQILQTCPGVHILATSREPLGIPGEESYRMPSLAVPPANPRITAQEAIAYESVALFVERAQAAQKTFILTDENAPIVADVVRRLDGIALAIELATPRIKILTVSELSRRLNERFKLLTGGSRTALPRQQTLRALIAWSYDLLTAEEQSLLRQLSVFRDGCTLEAACEVCTDERFEDWDSIGLLGSLVDKSLVVCDTERDESRYRLLESTRQFAQDRLDELHEIDTVAARHCAYYRALARGLWDRYFRANLHEWLSEVRGELENFRAAIAWGLKDSRAVESAADITGSLAGFWFQSLRPEGGALTTEALRRYPDDAPAPVRERLRQTLVLLRNGDPGADTLAEATESLQLSHGLDELTYAFALHNMAFSLENAGRRSEALERFDEALAIARRLAVPRYEATILGEMTTCLEGDDSREQRMEMLERAFAIFTNLGDRLRLWWVLARRAEARFEYGEVENALESAYQALAIGRDENNERAVMWMSMNIAAYLLSLDRVTEALPHVRESLEIAVRCEYALQTAWILQHFAQLAAISGDSHRAARLIGHVDASIAATARESTEQAGHDRIMQLLAASLSAIVVNELVSEGARMDRMGAIAEAMRVTVPATEVRSA